MYSYIQVKESTLSLLSRQTSTLQKNSQRLRYVFLLFGQLGLTFPRTILSATSSKATMANPLHQTHCFMYLFIFL